MGGGEGDSSSGVCGVRRGGGWRGERRRGSGVCVAGVWGSGVCVAAVLAACGSQGAVSARGQVEAEPAERLVSLTSYGVVPDDPARAARNREAIQRAIEEHAGSGAHLVLPAGEIFLDRGRYYTSVRFAGPRTTDLVLRGDPAQMSTIVLAGDATNGLWLGIEIVDGARRIGLRDFRIYQGDIANPSPTQQDHLIQINAQKHITGDVQLENIHFGPCIGDALRIAGSAPYYVENVRARDFTMQLDGQPQAPSRGARSGISLQRGFRNVELSDFYIGGVKNSPIDMEPTTPAAMDRLHIHDGVVDNTLGQTAHAISIGGYEDGARRVTPLTNSTLRNLVVLEGQVNIINTEALTVQDVTIYASGRGPMAGFSDPLVYVYHHNQDLLLSRVDITRDLGAAPGPLVLVLHGIDTYTTRMRVEGGAWISRVDPGSRTPFLAAFESAQHLSLEGLRLSVSGAAEGRYGIKLRPSARDIEHVSLRGVQIESADRELAGAVWVVATNQRAIDHLQLVDVTARTGRYGVVFDGTQGSRVQTTPILQGVVCTQCVRDWTAVNAAANKVFPIVGRDGRTRAHRFTGTLPPEHNLPAPVGSEYDYDDGARRLRFRKIAGTAADARGWRATEEALAGGPLDPDIEATRITTDGAQTYSLPDGTTDRQVKRITITAATNRPRGVLRPSRFAGGRALAWTSPGSVSLVWDDNRKMWSILGTPDRVSVE